MAAVVSRAALIFLDFGFDKSRTAVLFRRNSVRAGACGGFVTPAMMAVASCTGVAGPWRMRTLPTQLGWGGT